MHVCALYEAIHQAVCSASCDKKKHGCRSHVLSNVRSISSELSAFPQYIYIHIYIYIYIHIHVHYKLWWKALRNESRTYVLSSFVLTCFLLAYMRNSCWRHMSCAASVSWFTVGQTSQVNMLGMRWPYGRHEGTDSCHTWRVAGITGDDRWRSKSMEETQVFRCTSSASKIYILDDMCAYICVCRCIIRM